jgi:DNA ligase-1
MKPMLAKDYDGRDPVGLWMSEKFDGVRAVWTGAELLTRTGNRIDCPAWFTAGLPVVPLDGELWAGRGNFQRAKGMAQSLGRVGGWEGMQFAVFDAPQSGPFEERQATLQAAFPPHVCVVQHVRCTDREHLAAEFLRISQAGGEGIMLRIPRSPYLFDARSRYWMKVKRNPELYEGET